MYVRHIFASFCINNLDERVQMCTTPLTILRTSWQNDAACAQLFPKVEAQIRAQWGRRNWTQSQLYQCYLIIKQN